MFGASLSDCVLFSSVEHRTEQRVGCGCFPSFMSQNACSKSKLLCPSPSARRTQRVRIFFEVPEAGEDVHLDKLLSSSVGRATTLKK